MTPESHVSAMGLFFLSFLVTIERGEYRVTNLLGPSNSEMGQGEGGGPTCHIIGSNFLSMALMGDHLFLLHETFTKCFQHFYVR